MKRASPLSLVALLVVATGSIARAQSPDDIAAADALHSTPVGALTPMASVGAQGGKASHTISARYAHYSVTGLDGNTYALTLGHSGSPLTHSLTAGVQSCDPCSSGTLLMIGANARYSIASATMGTHSLSLGLSGSGGWGHRTNYTAYSLAASLPIGLRMDKVSNGTLGAFVSPGLGWGHGKNTATNASGSGVRPIIGAGLGWTTDSGIGIHAGFSKVVIDGGGSSLGVGLSWRHNMM